MCDIDVNCMDNSKLCYSEISSRIDVLLWNYSNWFTVNCCLN